MLWSLNLHKATAQTILLPILILNVVCRKFPEVSGSQQTPVFLDGTTLPIHQVQPTISLHISLVVEPFHTLEAQLTWLHEIVGGTHKVCKCKVASVRLNPGATPAALIRIIVNKT